MACYISHKTKQKLLCPIVPLKPSKTLLSFFLSFFFFVFLRNTFHVSFVRRFEPFSSPIISFLLIRCYNSQLTTHKGRWGSFLSYFCSLIICRGGKKLNPYPLVLGHTQGQVSTSCLITITCLRGFFEIIVYY